MQCSDVDFYWFFLYVTSLTTSSREKKNILLIRENFVVNISFYTHTNVRHASKAPKARRYQLSLQFILTQGAPIDLHRYR
jgi:hypothetical protein